MISLKQLLLAVWQRRPAPDGRSLLRSGALLSVLITEVFGRGSESQLADLLWSALLYTALGTMAVQWGGIPRGWMARFRRRWSFETGVDLRRSLSLPEALPEVVWRCTLSVSIGLAAAMALHTFLPGALRDIVLVVSPTLYFLYFGALSICCSALCLVGLSVLHFNIVSLATEWVGLPSWAEWALLGLHPVWIAVAVVTLPAWAPFAVLLMASCTCAALVFLGPDWELSLVWRARGDRQPPARCSAARMAWHAAWWVGGGVTCLVLQLLGEHLWLPDAGLGIAGTLGLVGAWVGAALLALMCCWQGWGHYLRVWRNPARAARARVVLLGASVDGLEPLVDILRTSGFVVELGDDAYSSVSVPVRLGPSPGPGQGRWALAATPEQLAQPDFHERLLRRSTIRRRRQFLHGLHDLWKQARRLPLTDVNGFWLAPHLWYVPMLFQDEEGRDAGQGERGVAYHPRIPLEARAEVRRVLRGAEIDLLFVERGITGRDLRHVFRALFEYDDLFGSQRRAEERHFVGIPGVRVLIHDHQLGKPLVDSGHVEPDYGVLACARILHVFRDEGGAEQDQLAPRDRQGIPISGPGAPLVSV